jgi:uncharacterized protein YjbI with pentapeptide repeats
VNTFTGDFDVVGKLKLEPTGRLQFNVGASGVNNRVAGTGIANFDGEFNFDLSAAGTSPGDKWTIANVATQSFGLGFSISGFTPYGSAYWTNGVYRFSETTGVLAFGPAPSNIYQWEYVNPANHAQGKQSSALIANDGYGLQAEPGLKAAGLNLEKAYLAGANLSGANFDSANLSDAELRDANLTNAKLQDGIYANASFSQVNLTNARLSGTFTRANFLHANLTAANLNGANLNGASLSDAILSDAMVANATLSSTHITLGQLYSTASYKEHDLSGVQLVGNDLPGANFAGQDLATASFYAAGLMDADFTNANLTNVEFANADLTRAILTGANLTNATLALANLSRANLRNANFTGANLTSTNLMGADVRGARLGGATTYNYGLICGKPSVGGCLYYTYGIIGSQIGGGVNLAQLKTTASYQAHDLSDIDLASTNLAGADFAGFNLTNAKFGGATLTGINLSGADARGSSDLNLSGAVVTNLIRADGHVLGLDLGAGQSLSIRDYDGSVSSPIILITIDQHFAMGAGSTLRMVLDADAWDSTISFAAGIPVTLGGTLELGFVNGIDLASQVNRTFDLFNWTGVTPIGTFAINSPYAWDLSNLYTTGEITLLSVSGSGGVATPSTTTPEPAPCFLLTVGLVAASMVRRSRRAYVLLPLFALLVIPSGQSLAALPLTQLTKVGTPIWKPVDFQLFSAPATPFDATFGQVYNTLLPLDTPLAGTYVPHVPPYDAELSAGALAGGYVSKSVFTPDAITLNPNGVYYAFMLVPDPGVTGTSRDFTSGPVIPNGLFPIANNVDVWLNGVLVDRLPGVDAIIPVQPRDDGKDGTSHLEVMQAIWHPWDDDVTVGPLGKYDLRASIRDVGGSGWDVHTFFRVALPGDYNYSGTVGPEDYAVWKSTFGSTTNFDADGNDDHFVNAADYTIWRNNLGATLPGSGSAGASLSRVGVPEPPTFALAAVVVLGRPVCRRRRRRGQ